MHIWLDLIVREVLFLGLLTASGAAPASFLSEHFDGAARFALAAAFGLCVGACVSVTLAYLFPASDTWWVLIALALASLIVANSRRRAPIRWPKTRSIVQLALVVLVVIASFDYPLALRNTVGPAGGYLISDTSGYVSEIDSVAHQGIRRAERTALPSADLAREAFSLYARGKQQLDVAPLEANVNELLGLGATDTHTPFLIAVLAVGALGAFAVVRSASRSSTWAAVLAGCCFAGPLFVELLMDGSEGAITGAALLAPIVALGLEALRRREPAVLVLLALLAAGMATLYPLFLPPIVLGAAAAIAVTGASGLRRITSRRRAILLAAGQLVGVVVLAAAFTPVAFARDARYWISLANGSFSLAGLPGYVLPINVLPGWVLQTRDFYSLYDLRHATAGHLLFGAGVPALMILVIAFAVGRNRVVLMMLVVASAAAVLAYYTYSSQSCTYCVQRNLIPVATLAAPALGLGVAAIAALRSRASVALAVAVAAVTLLTLGHEGIVERQRMANGSYLLDKQNRQALTALPANAGTVELEGFGQGPLPPSELPLVYNLVDEKTGGGVSVPTHVDDRSGLAYLGGPQPLGPSFKPDYTYVLTRLAGIRTRRRIVARYGPIALEQRTQSLDVTIAGGVSVGAVRFDPSGTAWVSRPLQFVVVGGRPGSQAWVSLELRNTVPVKVIGGPGVSTVRRSAGELRVCLHAVGNPPVRSARVELVFTPQPPPYTNERYAPGLPAPGVRLVAMAASAASCSLPTPRPPARRR